MKCISLLPVALATLTTMSAQAVVINANFTGVVQSQTSTSFALNSPISGSFAYDTASDRFLSYVVGGQSVATGYQSSASVTPDRYTALYTAQLSPLQLGVTVNSTFSLDLEGLAPWAASSSAIGLLTDTTQLASNLDLTSSSFRFYAANADGSGVRTVVAGLSGVSAVAAVPEPSTFAFLALGLGTLLLVNGKRSR